MAHDRFKPLRSSRGAFELLQFLGLGHLEHVTEFTVRARPEALVEVEVTMLACLAPEEFRTRRFKVSVEEEDPLQENTLLELLTEPDGQEQSPCTAAADFLESVLEGLTEGDQA